MNGKSGSGFQAVAVKHIRKSTVEPALPGGAIVLAINIFIQNVGAVAAQTNDFLFQALLHLFHQISMTFIPKLFVVKEGCTYTPARRLDDMFSNGVSFEGRQFTVPVDFDRGFSYLHIAPA
jgi:hypothetical protein